MVRTLNFRRVLWAFAFVGTFYLSLYFLRFFGVLGSEFDILVNCVSIISFTLFGVLIGIAISQKKINVRGLVVNMLLTFILFPLSPLIGFTIAQALPFSRQHKPIAVGVFTIGFAILYMRLIYYLRKKGFLKLAKTNGTEE